MVAFAFCRAWDANATLKGLLNSMPMSKAAGQLQHTWRHPLPLGGGMHLVAFLGLEQQFHSIELRIGQRP